MLLLNEKIINSVDQPPESTSCFVEQMAKIIENCQHSELKPMLMTQINNVLSYTFTFY